MGRRNLTELERNAILSFWEDLRKKVYVVFDVDLGEIDLLNIESKASELIDDQLEVVLAQSAYDGLNVRKMIELGIITKMIPIALEGLKRDSGYDRKLSALEEFFGDLLLVYGEEEYDDEDEEQEEDEGPEVLDYAEELSSDGSWEEEKASAPIPLDPGHRRFAALSLGSEDLVFLMPKGLYEVITRAVRTGELEPSDEAEYVYEDESCSITIRVSHRRRSA